MFWQKFWYNNWRKITTVALVVVTLAVVVPLLIFFPPALIFIAGLAPFAAPLLTMAAPSAIALVSAVAAATVFLATFVFHKLTDLLSKEVIQSTCFADIELLEIIAKTPRYGKLGAFLVSLGIGAVAALGTGLVAGLALGMAVLSAPLWIAVGAAFGIGLVGSGILHAAGYRANKYENHCRDELEKIANVESNNENSVLPEQESHGCLSFFKIGKTIPKPFAKPKKEEIEKPAPLPSDSFYDAPTLEPTKPSKMGLFCSWLRGSCSDHKPPPPPGPSPYTFGSL